MKDTVNWSRVELNWEELEGSLAELERSGGKWKQKERD
jgi:hypothetical protein